MIIGTPKEIKDKEFRIGIIPATVMELVKQGHQVLIEKGAGVGSDIADDEFRAVGAKIVDTAEEVWTSSDLVVKVKEPQKQEFPLMKESQVLFTFLHLAPDPEQTKSILERKIVGIAYETIEAEDGTLPLLVPMSEVAGRMSIQIGAHYLEKANGGRGVLLGGVPGVPPGNVIILGGGIVGINAAKMAIGLGANVTIVDIDAEKLRYIDDIFSGRVVTLMSNPNNIKNALAKADLVIGAVLIAGAAAPKLVTKEMLSSMKNGAVIVDVAVDQGGCFETTNPTSHSKPTFYVDGVLHYCVANIPGAVPRTSTFALNNATAPYIIKLAAQGWKYAIKDDPGFQEGVNVCVGKLTCKPVADSLNLPYTPLEEAMRLC